MNAPGAMQALCTRPWALVGLLGVAALAGGALADDPPEMLIAESQWPVRITTHLDRLAATAPALITRGEARSGAVRIRRAEHRGLGIVLEIEPPDRSDESGRSLRLAEFVFVSFSPPAAAADDVSKRGPMKHISFSDVERGVWWELYEPKSSPARGLVVHLGGNRYVRRALLADGWFVLTSSGTGRYFEQSRHPRTFRIAADADIEPVASSMAAVVDDELADWPYSLEAVLDYLAEHYRNVPRRPAAVMGFSIGAIGLPAIVARLPKRFEAAVIVAGGADLLRISQTSHKADLGMRLEWTGSASAKGAFARLDNAYLAHTRLDPHSTAAALHDMPILMFHGSLDRVVPARTGEELWRCLGKPERLKFPVGHRHLLRVIMRFQAGRIVRWLDTSVDKRAVKGPRPGRP